MLWIWWIGAALVLGVIETLTTDFIFLMLAGGALGGALADALGLPVWGQAIVFGIVSIVLLVLVRPWAKRVLHKSSPEYSSNAQALVGESAVAITEITGADGRVRLAGAEWSARLADDAEASASVIPAGAELTVVSIDGAVAVVRPTN